jgi:hypothetical protein
MSPALDIASILNAPSAPGIVDRVVGDSLFYVSLESGASIGFRPSDLLIKSHGTVNCYRGQYFRELGVKNGAIVEVFGLDNPLVPARVVVNLDKRSSLLSRLLR